jgi:hypothetical protein
VHFNKFWMANLRIYEHIKYESYCRILCNRNEKIINQKFVLLTLNYIIQHNLYVHLHP